FVYRLGIGRGVSYRPPALWLRPPHAERRPHLDTRPRQRNRALVRTILSAARPQHRSPALVICHGHISSGARHVRTRMECPREYSQRDSASSSRLAERHNQRCPLWHHAPRSILHPERHAVDRRGTTSSCRVSSRLKNFGCTGRWKHNPPTAP